MFAKPVDSRRHPRRQLFVARKAQGRLLLRVVVYCVATSLLTAFVAYVAQSLFQWNPFWAAALAPLVLLIFLPIVLFDAARTSNRLVGPIARAQGAVRGVANNDPVAPLGIRHGDDWTEWTQDFNSMLARINSFRSATREESAEGTSAW